MLYLEQIKQYVSDSEKYQIAAQEVTLDVLNRVKDYSPDERRAYLNHPDNIPFAAENIKHFFCAAVQLAQKKRIIIPDSVDLDWDGYVNSAFDIYREIIEDYTIPSSPASPRSAAERMCEDRHEPTL